MLSNRNKWKETGESVPGVNGERRRRLRTERGGRGVICTSECRGTEMWKPILWYRVGITSKGNLDADGDLVSIAGARGGDVGAELSVLGSASIRSGIGGG